jgi:hypothetical protein
MTVNSTDAPSISNISQPTCSVSTGTIQVSEISGIEFKLDNGSYQSSGTFSGVSSGAHTVYARNTTTGCVSAGTDVTIDPVPNNCSTVVNLKLFIQGYYLGSDMMDQVMVNQGTGSTDEVELITVELRNELSPYDVVATSQAMLMADGTAHVEFSPSVSSGNYYIAVHTRNALQTWSMYALAFPTTTSYDFTDDAAKAYDSNMADLGDGRWGFYSGDINQDEAIDDLDFNEFRPVWRAGDGGDQVSDLNGDGTVDDLDFNLFRPNWRTGYGSAHPF